MVRVRVGRGGGAGVVWTAAALVGWRIGDQSWLSAASERGRVELAGRAANEPSRKLKFYNDGEGPYYGFHI